MNESSRSIQSTLSRNDKNFECLPLGRVAITPAPSVLDQRLGNELGRFLCEETLPIEGLHEYCNENKYKLVLISMVLFLGCLLTRKARLLKYKGIKIGPGIADWAVRTSRSGRIEFNWRFLRIIYAALRQYYGAKQVLSNYDVAILIGLDESYYQFNIVAQVALKNGVPSILFRGGQKARIDPFCVRTMSARGDLDSYRRLIKDKRREDLSVYLKQLDMIINGDNRYEYMPIKPNDEAGYNPHSISLDRGDIIFVVYLHDFFDAVGYYGDTIFDDHYQWADFVISFLTRRKVNVVVKTHPNAIPANNVPVAALKKKYRGIVSFADSVATKNILQCKIACVLTVNGSVILEAARCGITTITAGRHPYQQFKVSLNPSTKRELIDALEWVLRGGRLAIDQLEVAGAFYAHYIHQSNKEFNIPMTDFSIEDWNECFPNSPYPSANYERHAALYASEIAYNFAYQKFRANLSNITKVIINYREQFLWEQNNYAIDGIR